MTNFPTVSIEDVFSPSILNNRIVLENFLGRYGNMSVEAVCKMCLIVKHINPKQIFEIGTFNGLTSSQMARNCDAVIYTLDLPPGETALLNKSDLEISLSRGNKTGEYFRGNPQVIQLWGNSRTFDFSEYYGNMDLVFIDGGHDPLTKKSDSENALKMLNENGVIVWDNYLDDTAPDVTPALNELDWPIYHLRKTCLAVYVKS